MLYESDVKGLMTVGKLALDKESQEASKRALLGFVKINIMENKFHRGYLNNRETNEEQAQVLLNEFLTHGCQPMQNWLIACVDDPTNAFATPDGQPLVYSADPETAPVVEFKSDHPVWRIAGGHRVRAVTLGHKSVSEQVHQSTELATRLENRVVHVEGAGSAEHATAKQKVEYWQRVLELIMAMWLDWPLQVFDRRMSPLPSTDR